MDGGDEQSALIPNCTPLTMIHVFTPPLVLILALLLSGSGGTPVRAAENANEAAGADAGKIGRAEQTQKDEDKLDDQERRMFQRFRQAFREAATLKLYNRHLQEVIDSQKKEEASLHRQIKEIEVTRRELVPLMYRMLDSLEAFVQLDLPFLQDERRKRLKRLREMLVTAAVENAEKYRRILEAYQIESEYGRTIEAYRADLDTNGETRPVDFLRLGRVALYYQALDGSETGVWDHNKKTWQTLPSEYRKPVRDGLRIARKQASPTLLTLPVPAPEVVR
jgi:Protein of unknown function (DUF3450)